MFLSGWLNSPVMRLAALAVVAFCLFSSTAVFWTLPGRFLTGASAAAGIALINSVGNLGGYVGPFGIGLLKEYTEIWLLVCISYLSSCFWLDSDLHRLCQARTSKHKQ